MLGDEKIILIKGDESKWYEQAIFIVKKNIEVDNPEPIDFVAEAEKIIGGHMLKSMEISDNMAVAKSAARTKYRKSSNFDVFLNSLMLGSCVLMVGLLLMSYR